ncbi:3'-5' exonuclease [Rheinheimera sp.]|uniref:3'-5' exonuclease n=1 Tax=Rheinheimera sp. TaxID=1869214 RepID=UPI00307CEE26
MMNHIMVDLESAGEGSNAPIVAIGAVAFDPYTGETGSEFYMTITLSSAVKYSSGIEPGAVVWWMKQSDEARAVFRDEKARSFLEVLLEFDAWLATVCEYKKRRIWGNGCDFDPVILSNGYKAAGFQVPWGRYAARGCRDIVDLGRDLLNIDPKNELKMEGVAHNALDDAYHQVRYVSAILRELKRRTNTLPPSLAA